MRLTAYKNIKEGSFFTGFEPECCINAGAMNDFQAAVRKVDKRCVFKFDRSIVPKAGDETTEINTPVLRSDESIALLDEIFMLIDQFGYTNSTCSVHANFSPVSKKNHEKINPFFLAEQEIWKRMRSDFKRDGNKYCSDVILRSDIRQNPSVILKEKVSKAGTENGMFWDKFRGEEASVDYKHRNAISLWRYLIQMQDFKKFGRKKLVKCHWHYAIVNFENYKPTHTKDSRVEIRAFGNENYHLKLPLITQYIDEVLALLKESFNHPVQIEG